MVVKLHSTIYLAMSALFFSACDPTGRVEGPLVRVGTKEIGELELREFEAKLPDYLKSPEQGSKAVRDLLQSLVDRQIMVLEAEALGYADTADVQRRINRFRVEKLTSQVQPAEIVQKAKPTEEEIRNVYKDYHWDRRVWPAHILSHSKEEALEVIKELRAGREFSQLARERSRADDAEQGGDLAQYYGVEDSAPYLIEAVFKLPVGAFSEPILTKDGYEIVKVMDEQQVPLEEVRAKLNRIVFRRNFAREYSKYVESLEDKYEVSYHSEGIKTVLSAGKSLAALSAEDENLPLISYSNGRSISIGEGSHVLTTTGSPLALLKDSLSVVNELRARVMADTLMVLEAIERGMDQEPAFLAYMTEQYNKIMVGKLRRFEVVKKVEVSEEELRAKYEEEKEDYRLPAQIELTEILVATEKQARELAERIRAGEDMASLSLKHTQRPEGQKTAGHLHIAEGDEEKWGSYYAHFQAAEKGSLVGPIQGADGFSIFRVEDRVSGRLRPLQEVRNIVFYKLKRRKNQAAFEPYIAQLRAKYKDQIQWDDAAIDALGSQWGS